MTIRHLKIFVAVCEEGGVTKAGKKLFMAQPTVSFAINELEKHYDTKLFDRISKRMYLTEAGKKLLPYAQHITSMFDEMELEAQEWDSGSTLHIGASITIGSRLLPELIHNYKRECPPVEVTVQIDNSEKIEQAVLDNKIDIGLIEGFSHSDCLIDNTFREDELILICAPNHPWAAQEYIRLEQLLEEPFLMREKGSGGREIWESAFLVHGIELKPAWESISTQAIVQAVACGLGVAVLPKLLVENQLVQQSIISRPIEGISLSRNFHIIYHKNKYLTGSVKKFIRQCYAGIDSIPT